MYKSIEPGSVKNNNSLLFFFFILFGMDGWSEAWRQQKHKANLWGSKLCPTSRRLSSIAMHGHVRSIELAPVNTTELLRHRIWLWNLCGIQKTLYWISGNEPVQYRQSASVWLTRSAVTRHPARAVSNDSQWGNKEKYWLSIKLRMQKKVQERQKSNLAAGDGSPDGDLYIKSKWNVRGGLDRMWNEVRTRNQKLKIHPAPCKHASIAQNDFEIHYEGCGGKRGKKITGGCKSGQNWRARLQNMGETGSKRFEKAINRLNSTKQDTRADVGALATGIPTPNVHHGRSNKNILNEIKNKKMWFAHISFS